MFWRGLLHRQDMFRLRFPDDVKVTLGAVLGIVAGMEAVTVSLTVIGRAHNWIWQSHSKEIVFAYRMQGNKTVPLAGFSMDLNNRCGVGGSPYQRKTKLELVIAGNIK
jgi:hypothetical protein